MEERKHPFEPVYDSDSKILILGTVPSVVSCQKGFYYMHPTNRFWKILSDIYQADFYHASIEEKKKLILSHHLALFDVIERCQIKRSSDQSIKDVKIQSFTTLLENSNIEKVLLNGKKAFEIWSRIYPEWKDKSICLPSTSSANATWKTEDLKNQWEKALLS